MSLPALIFTISTVAALCAWLYWTIRNAPIIDEPDILSYQELLTLVRIAEGSPEPIPQPVFDLYGSTTAENLTLDEYRLVRQIFADLVLVAENDYLEYL